MQTAKEKYTYADHLDAHSEIATRENAEALVRLRAKRWLQRKFVVEVSAMATRLKVPNNRRNSQRQIVEFLDTLVWPLWYDVVLKEKNIIAGTEIFGSKVKKVGRDRRLTLEDGRRVTPTDLDPRYGELHRELYPQYN